MSKLTPQFHVVRINSTTTYSIEIPDTSEGIDMLDEVGRMFSHRGEYDTAKRIAAIVQDRRIELRSPTPGAKSRTEGKQVVPKKTTKVPAKVQDSTSTGCSRCGRLRASIHHDLEQNPAAHPYREPRT